MMTSTSNPSQSSRSNTLGFTIIQKPYLDMPNGLSWHEQETRRNEMFLGCCCYGCGGDECGDGK
mgnify:CR=1 FL=1